MYVENPGADMYKSDVYIVKTGNSAATMGQAIPALTSLALKLLKGEEIGTPDEDNYMERGIRVNYFAEERGSKELLTCLSKS